MREIRTLRATWRGLETWCGSGLPGHTGAPALDPTDERGWETERCRMAQATAPLFDSTKSVQTITGKCDPCVRYCPIATK